MYVDSFKYFWYFESSLHHKSLNLGLTKHLIELGFIGDYYSKTKAENKIVNKCISSDFVGCYKKQSLKDNSN